MQETFRRPYAESGSHADKMRHTPARQIYTQGVVRESEFKKPYRENDYEEMEYRLDPDPGQDLPKLPDETPHDPDLIDDAGEGGGAGDDNAKLVFIATAKGCFKKGELRYVKIAGSYPIIQVTVSQFADEVSGFSVVSGLGSYGVTVCATGTDKLLGWVSLDVKMVARKTITATAGVNVSKCPDSCACTEGVSIGYTTLSMDLGAFQTLTVENPSPGDAPDCYTWVIRSGGGALSQETGLETVYQAPDTNVCCAANPVIDLFCDQTLVDTIRIAVTDIGGDWSSTLAYIIHRYDLSQDIGFCVVNPNLYVNCGIEKQWVTCSNEVATWAWCSNSYYTIGYTGDCETCLSQIEASGGVEECDAPFVRNIPEDIRTQEAAQNSCCPEALFGIIATGC